MTDAFDTVVVVRAACETVPVYVPILEHKPLFRTCFHPILISLLPSVSLSYLIQHFHKDVTRTGAGEGRHRSERRGLVVPRRRCRRHPGKVDIARAVDGRAVEAKLPLRLLFP